MNISNYSSIKAEKAKCCTKTHIRRLITKENHTVQLFEMQPGGSSPLHKHPEEHQIFVLDGEGEVFDGEKAVPVKSGDFISVGTNQLHQIKNTNAKTLMFLTTTTYGEK